MIDRIAGVLDLFSPTNKQGIGAGGQDSAAASGYLPELQLEMSDDELLRLSKKWEQEWGTVSEDLSARQKLMVRYWLGVKAEPKPGEDSSSRKPKADNLIYEALETFLPRATSRNPDPLVVGDGTELGNLVADTAAKSLRHVAQLPSVRLKMTLRDAARDSQLRFVGAVKTGWSGSDDDVSAEYVRADRLILDPNSTVRNAIYDGRYAGIACEDTASDLAKRFPSAQEAIDRESDGKEGTKLRYVEWWSDGETPAVFWTMGKAVLGKMRNPHFNYPTTEDVTDEFGNVTQKQVGGRNYFARPQIPLTLLVTQGVGRHPFDPTNGLHQCLSMQDVVTKRWSQIDRNCDNANNSIIASLDYFSEDQASQAAQAMRNGDVMLQPKGQAGEGIKRDPGQSLPGDVYQNLQDARQRILSVYGVNGFSPATLAQDRTVRGKMITASADSDRIGGGFGECLELFAARIYEQLLQMMHVYYDEPKMATVVGADKAREWVALSSSDLAAVSLTVSVQEGSMTPQDSMSKRQEALDLWSANALDPITLFERLDFENPRETAKSLFLWQRNPSALFPELMQPAPLNGAPPPNGPTSPENGQPPQQGPAQAPSANPPPNPSGSPSTAIPLQPLPQ